MCGLIPSVSNIFLSLSFGGFGLSVKLTTLTAKPLPILLATLNLKLRYFAVFNTIILVYKYKSVKKQTCLQAKLEYGDPRELMKKVMVKPLSDDRSLNVIVMPEFAQSEGAQEVVDNLIRRANVTAITTSPYVMELSDGPDASREPPSDATAGKVRLLDRELFGRRSMNVRVSPSFTPDISLYEGLCYQPQATDALTSREGRCVGDLIDAAKERGLKACLQVQAAIHPGYRVQFGGAQPEDRCKLPDGSEHEDRVDCNGSLASPHVRDYGCAMIRDLVRAYPNVNTLRFDWAEYPPYSFDSIFFDFGVHAEAAARRLGYDFDRMRHDALGLRSILLGELTNEHLQLVCNAADASELPWLAQFPGMLDLLRFKADMVEELVCAYKQTLDEETGGRIGLEVHGFPEPWTALSGFNVERIAGHCAAIGIKLYTMHWPMMIREYADRIRGANLQLDEKLLLGALYNLLDLTDERLPTRVKDVRYPEPDMRHPVDDATQARKILAARRQAHDTPVHAFAHAYGPLDDFRKRMEVAWQTSGHQMVVNRYGYLSDRKLDILGEVTKPYPLQGRS